MSAMPRTAMVLAAGRGERLRPITDTLPKPLVVVDGATMLDQALDKLTAAGIEQAVVNTHHLGERIQTHLAGREKPAITISHEAELLDTGGGVANALGHLGEAPFFVLNSDVVMFDGPQAALSRLAAAWCDERMDALLLTHATVRAHGYSGRGDFLLSPDGVLARRRDREIAPYLFTGVQLLHPRLFTDCPEGAFSLNRLYDKAAEAGRLYGLAHDGEWLHVGTPAALEAVEQILAEIR
jgi:N-acetyl-alpha-D-muramate 1-phosphate uridylyltransferase